MGYIAELRQVLGHRPLVMVGACAVLLNDENKILMLLRADNHCWGLPGGALEPGESLEQCARREILEVTGLRCGELKLVTVGSGAGYYYRYPNGDEVHNVCAVYRCVDFSGTPKQMQNPSH